MDKTSKKFKMWRTIGLVSLTIVVIGLIILTVFMTQKKDNSKVEVTHSIGDTFIINEKCEFKVVGIEFLTTSEQAGVQLLSGQCLAKIKIETTAISKSTIKKSDIKLNDKKADSTSFGSKVVVKETETITLEIGFIVAHDSILPLNLTMYGCKIPMGSSLVVEGIK